MTTGIPMRLWRDDRLANHAQQLACTHLIDHPRWWAHTQAVAAQTATVASILAPESQHLLVAAAWLHDIGKATTLAHNDFHAVDGAEFARSQTFPETVVELVAHHSGAWSEAIERGLVTELSRYLVPPQAFLDIITYADLITDPDGQPTTVWARLTDIKRRYPADHPTLRATVRAAPTLVASAQRVRQRLAAYDEFAASTIFERTHP